jgi:hypothetical protein
MHMMSTITTRARNTVGVLSATRLMFNGILRCIIAYNVLANTTRLLVEAGLMLYQQIKSNYSREYLGITLEINRANIAFRAVINVIWFSDIFPVYISGV